LPEGVAAAAWQFINGALAENPHRVGKPFSGDLAGLWFARRGEYRVVYSIEEDIVTVTIPRLGHRRDGYRSNDRPRGTYSRYFEAVSHHQSTT
jgi:mRNA-degrading endonuclease RelE of RelBE toxin-antitoxin system